AKSSTKKSSNPHPALYRKLLLVRDEIANDEHKRASEIAGNKALEAMCHLLPQTLPKMYLVKGMSALRADAYGERFLKVILEYVKHHGIGNAAADDDEDSDAGLYRRRQPVKG